MLKNFLLYFITICAVLVIVYVFIGSESKGYKAGAELIRFYGWDISDKPIESENIIIPNEFDQMYEDYNNMQLEAGLDLSPYKGMRAVRYTFAVNNYPSNQKNVVANVIVLNYQAIGGDICTRNLDGFMHSLKFPSAA